MPRRRNDDWRAFPMNAKAQRQEQAKRTQTASGWVGLSREQFAQWVSANARRMAQSREAHLVSPWTVGTVR